MATIHEIAPDVYRVTVFEQRFNLQFNHFLVRDDQPLLFHTGYNSMFAELKEAVTRLLDPSKIRWIGFSHFESDECGALNQWLALAPEAQAICTFLAATLSVNDFAIRPARAMVEEDALETGKYRFRFCSTAHLPHGWDAGVLFEETRQTLFCSDLLFHWGEVEPLTTSDITERSRQSLMEMQKTPFSYSVPYTPQTDRILERLAALKPALLATMHGSCYQGDGAGALRTYGAIIREILSGP